MRNKSDEKKVHSVCTELSINLRYRKAKLCCPVPTYAMISLVYNSVADPGCLSRIPDPTFSIPDPGSELSPSRIPDPHKRI
jgi:hypothetical protein